MKKFLIMSLLVLSSSWAFAAEKADFFNAAPDMWELLSYEDVFYDEVAEERVYKVNYSYVLIEDCSPSLDGDNCGPADVEGALATTCEYFVEDLYFDTMRASGVTCDQDIEDVIGSPVLFDEL